VHERRVHPLKVGITGLPGAGKSTVAQMFAALGAAVFDADEAVRRLYAPGGAAARALLARHPELDDGRGGVDRAKLRLRLRENPELLEELEKIVHPLVAAARDRFIGRAGQTGAPLVVLEIPLLFETGAEQELDFVIWVEAPEEARHARLRERAGFDAALNAALEARLLPAEEKRRRADFVIDTSGTLEDVREQVEALYRYA